MNYFGEYKLCNQAIIDEKLSFNIYTSDISDENIFHVDKNKFFIFCDGFINNLDDFFINSRTDISSYEKIAILYCKNKKFYEHLSGSYSIIIFDYSNNSLMLIRDPRGSRTIYFAKSKQSFLFSSSLAPLIEKLDKVSINQKRMSQYISLNYEEHSSTFFNEINRLEPSTYLKLRFNEVCKKKYNLSRNLFKEYNKKTTINDFKNYLYKSLNSSVNKTKNIGLMMSGGLDSSAIAISLKQNNYRDIKMYSANFSHLPPVTRSRIDEKGYQKNISELTGYVHKNNELEGVSILNPINDNLEIFNEPTFFINSYIFHHIKDALLQDKIDIVLDGHDGDSIVSHGYEVLFFYLKTLKIFSFIREMYCYSKINKIPTFKAFYIFLKPLFKLNKFINNTLLKNSLYKKIKISRIKFYDSHEKKIDQPLGILAAENRNTFFRYFDIDNYSPFYNEELIDFCLKMNPKNKFNMGYSRKILRDFLHHYLPHSHAYRPNKANLKHGIEHNFNDLDKKIFFDEFKNTHTSLKKIIDFNKLRKINHKIKNDISLNEGEIMNIFVFVSANTFLNKYDPIKILIE